MSVQLFLRRYFILFMLGILILSCHSSSKSSENENALDLSKPLYIYVGTYTQNSDTSAEKSKGIYLYKMDPTSGTLSFVSASPQTENPSYLVIHPSKKWLYAVNETGDEKESGHISSFSIDSKNMELKFINKVSSQGTYPCYVSVDNSGKYAMTANYGSGTVALFSIKNDGSLSEAVSVHQHLRKVTDEPTVQPHAHMIIQGPGEQNIYSSDLGTDMIWVYQIDTIKNILSPGKQHIPTQNGSGPRHIEFHPNRQWVYVINELNGTVEAYTTGSKFGVWSRFQIITTLKVNEKGPASCADIHITPDGKYLYASNRGEINNLAIYEINQQSGELQLTGFHDVGGKTPRNFVIDPSGSFLIVANQNSNNIVTFKIDKATGQLIETGKSVSVPAPVCLKFL